MQNIGNLLERFKNLVAPDEVTRKELMGVIKSETGIELAIEDITIDEPIAYIKCSGAERSEIFQKKKKILDVLSSVDKKIIDIR